MNNIRFLKKQEIDISRWDELIERSVNSLPYAFGWYLDAVAENWGALVFDNYEAVMPLVWMRRLGVKILYQPYYCQQLGFFSKKTITKELATGFLKKAFEQTRFADINLNSSAAIIAHDYGLKPKKNLVLELNKEYSELKKAYSENHRRNISKATKAGLTYSTEIGLQEFQQFYLKNIDRKRENFKKKHEKVFLSLTKSLVSRNKAKIFAVINTERKVVAEVMGVYHQNSVIGIINSSSAEGKKNGASHFLYDRIIENHSKKGLILDFEGSSVPTIARFYEGFGARESGFYNLRRRF